MDDADLFGSQADYARYSGCSKAYVSKLKASGGLVFADDGRVDFVATDRLRKKNADPARQLSQPEPAAPSATMVPYVADSFQAERTRRERAAARMAELDLQEREGDLLKRRDVVDATVEAARQIAQSMNSILGFAEELEAAARNGGSVAVRNVLKRLIGGLQEQVADTFARIAEGSDEPADESDSADAEEIPPSERDEGDSGSAGLGAGA